MLKRLKCSRKSSLHNEDRWNILKTWLCGEYIHYFLMHWFQTQSIHSKLCCSTLLYKGSFDFATDLIHVGWRYLKEKREPLNLRVWGFECIGMVRVHFSLQREMSLQIITKLFTFTLCRGISIMMRSAPFRMAISPTIWNKGSLNSLMNMKMMRVRYDCFLRHYLNPIHRVLELTKMGQKVLSIANIKTLHE